LPSGDNAVQRERNAFTFVESISCLKQFSFVVHLNTIFYCRFLSAGACVQYVVNTTGVAFSLDIVFFQVLGNQFFVFLLLEFLAICKKLILIRLEAFFRHYLFNLKEIGDVHRAVYAWGQWSADEVFEELG
jgi:uncharacterized membrane protein